MPDTHRSTYTIIFLTPDGAPANAVNAVITPYYAGSAPPGYQPPLGIWGPTDPRPSNPISGPVFPGMPGYEPPVPPEIPTNPPDDNGWLKPPPADGGWGYHQDYGWLYKPAGASPKR